MATNSGGNAAVASVSVSGSNNNQQQGQGQPEQLICTPFLLPAGFQVGSSVIGLDINRQQIANLVHQIPVSSAQQQQQTLNMLQAALPKQEPLQLSQQNQQQQNNNNKLKQQRTNHQQQQQQLIAAAHPQQIAPHLLTTAIAFPGNPLQSHMQQQHTLQAQQHQQQHAIIIPASAATSQVRTTSHNVASFSSAALSTVWLCPACKIPFKSASELQGHLSAHTKAEKSVPCQQCGKLFASAERVRIHIRVAHGEKSCACEICGSGFSYRCKLLDHMRTHTGDKPFHCDVCGRSFSQKNHLRRHQMIHTGERPYPCEVCGRGFYRKDKLSRHRRIHLNPGSGARNARNANSNNTTTTTTTAPQHIVASVSQTQPATFQLIPVHVAAAPFKNAPLATSATQQWVTTQQLHVVANNSESTPSNVSTPTTSS